MVISSENDPNSARDDGIIGLWRGRSLDRCAGGPLVLRPLVSTTGEVQETGMHGYYRFSTTAG